MLARLALAACLAFTVSGVAAADIAVRPINPDGDDGRSISVGLTGSMVAGDVDRLRVALTEAAATGRTPIAVYLDSPGGDLIEGLKLAEFVRSAHLRTIVARNRTCASACFLLLAAGSPRYVRPGARIGIHGASVNGVETAEALAGTVVMARIAAEYGIPDAIVGRLVKTPGDRIVWLTPDEVRSIVGEVAYQP